MQQHIVLSPEDAWKLQKLKIASYTLVGAYALVMAYRVGCDVLMPEAEGADTASSSIGSSSEAAPSCASTMLNIVSKTISEHAGPAFFLGTSTALTALYCWAEPHLPLLVRRDAPEGGADAAHHAGPNNV